MLRLENVAWGTPTGRPLVSGVSLELKPGEWLVVRGPNGSGKSTLLQALMGKLQYSGRMDRRYKRLGYLPQLENTEYHIPSTLKDVLSLGGTAIRDDWGLLNAEQLGHSWNTASGGERKRTLLTRLLNQDSDFLCLDEPLNHLDRESRIAMASALKKVVANSERAGVLVAHEGFELKDLSGMRCLELLISDGKAKVQAIG